MATAENMIPDRSSLNETLSGNVRNLSAPISEEDLSARAEYYEEEEPAKGGGGGGILESVPFLLTGLILSIVALVVLLAFETQRAASQAEYVERSSQLLALAQQVSIDARDATGGEDSAFASLQEARQSFGTIIGSLANGGQDMAALPAAQSHLLAPVAESWSAIEPNVDTILGFRNALSNTRDQVKVVNELAPLLLARSDEAVDAIISESGDVQVVNEAARQRGLSQRIVKDVNIYAKGEIDAAAAAGQIGRDLAEFQTVFAQLRRIGGPITQARLEGTDKTFNDMLASITSLFRDAAGFFEAQNSSLTIQETTDELLPAVQGLVQGITNAKPAGIAAYLPWIVAGLIGAFLLLLGRALINDARNRAALSASQNRDTQDAILKLLDEMGSLADGDLTIEAEVTDQITGAIADSMNFAVKEMRDLVTRINDASRQVAKESQSTSATAQALLVASAKQAKQITSTAETVQSMSISMEDMSTEALRSADVAKSSVDVAKRGARAVRETIRGMDGMRDQIQETSKRIKRLGESSQQISDIVGLIDDIAEQTNILSLNAAIQAAMAGEAGKGFAVVADEVQRLAERSAEATKQINVLVRNIQSDTNEAVISMEYATQGVVDGTRVADAAGQALNEIENVSERMSGLIEKMAEKAHGQSESATEVSARMTFIRNVTRNTAQNAKHTAESIGKLTSLAEDLEQSVAGFRIPV
jgi:twitching motility protein PilJ